MIWINLHIQVFKITCKSSSQVKVYLFYFPGKVLASTFFKALELTTSFMRTTLRNYIIYWRRILI